MSNTVPATVLSAASVNPAPSSMNPVPLTAEGPSVRPQLTVVPPTMTPEPAPVQGREKSQEAPAAPPASPVAPEGSPAADIPPELPELLRLYRAQQRECWLCKRIAGAIDSGKDPSDDDRWHFTTCVLSWAHI